MACLEGMVADILFVMLANAPSVKTLWRLIRASSRMYSVFRSHRELILATVIHREIGPKILCDAQAALDSSRFSTRGLLKDEAITWIAKYQAEMNKKCLLSAISWESDSLPLCIIHRDVKFFADLFVRERLPILNRGLEKGNSVSINDQECYLEELPTTEKTRLYRGIYRYAIYGNLYYHQQNRPRKQTLLVAQAQDQSHSFLRLFPAWQVEELSCINDFIEDKILRKWKEAEDYVYETLKADPPSWDLERDRHQSRWDCDFFSHFHKVRKFKHIQKYMATMSLSDLREFLTAKDEGLIHILKKNGLNYSHDFLTEALDEEPYHPIWETPEYQEYEGALASEMKVRFEGDATSRPNEAWLWAHEYRPCELYVQSTPDFAIGEGLRRFGYVFWDSRRLQDLGLLQKELVNPFFYVSLYLY